MSLTPLRFSGISTFSDDFQAIVDRSVGIASLPLKAIQQDQMRLLSEKAAVGTLNSLVAKLASSLDRLGQQSVNAAVRATSSSSRVSVSATQGAIPGNWRIDSVDSIAEASIATATVGLATASETELAGAGNFLRLKVGSEVQEIHLQPGEDNLIGVRDRINALGAGVTASILFSGGASGEHFLSLAATETGAQAIELEVRAEAAPDEPGTQLLTLTRPGTDAVLWINGIRIQSPTNVIEGAVSGLTITVNQATEGESILLSATANRSGIQAELASFAADYNALAEALDGQSGKDGGVLRGNSLIRELRSRLSALSAFETAGEVDSFAAIGLEFDRNGVLSLNEPLIDGMDDARFQSALAFLKSDGGLASLASQFTAFSDLDNGLIQQQIDEFDSADLRMSKQIEEMTARINSMQESLLVRLQQADALLAMLDSQKSMLDASLQGLNVVLFGKKT